LSIEEGLSRIGARRVGNEERKLRGWMGEEERQGGVGREKEEGSVGYNRERKGGAGGGIEVCRSLTRTKTYALLSIWGSHC
jgi:hypothetical protein